MINTQVSHSKKASENQVKNTLLQVKSLFTRDSLSSRPTEYFHKYVRGTNGVVRGIIHNSGAVWQEQRRFALRAFRDFGFGKKVHKKYGHIYGNNTTGGHREI